MLLRDGGPIATYAEFALLPKRHRENIVNKRIKNLGLEKGDIIPEIGDVMRSYVTPGEVRTSVISDVNYRERTCQVTTSQHIAGSNELPYRKKRLVSNISLRQAATHIVDLNGSGLTHAEKDITDRYIERGDHTSAGIIELKPVSE